MYLIFKRRAWRANPEWPGGLEPHGNARRTKVGIVETIEQAREICAEANKNAPRGPSLFVWHEFESL